MPQNYKPHDELNWFFENPIVLEHGAEYVHDYAFTICADLRKP